MRKVRRNPQVVSDEVEGTVMLCNTGPVEFFRINTTGALIWRLCDESTVEDIVRRLSEAYPSEDRKRLTEEVERFVTSLQEAGLVEVVEAPPSGGRLRVDTVEGIGPRTAERLFDIRVHTVQDLAAASPADVAAAVGVSRERATQFIAMAGVILRLSATLQRDEVAELVVRGAQISSVEELASADRDDLYAKVRHALASRRVRVPQGFSVTPEDVEQWIHAAGQAVR